jgi:uncharacterized protein YraI
MFAFHRLPFHRRRRIASGIAAVALYSAATSLPFAAGATPPGQMAGSTGERAGPPTLCVATQGIGSLDLRFGPSERHALLLRIPAGTCGLKVAGQCVGGWCEVEHAGRRGWADTRFIAVEERGASPSAPVAVPMRRAEPQGNPVASKAGRAGAERETGAVSRPAQEPAKGAAKGVGGSGAAAKAPAAAVEAGAGGRSEARAQPSLLPPAAAARPEPASRSGAPRGAAGAADAARDVATDPAGAPLPPVKAAANADVPPAGRTHVRGPSRAAAEKRASKRRGSARVAREARVRARQERRRLRAVASARRYRGPVRPWGFGIAGGLGFGPGLSIGLAGPGFHLGPRVRPGRCVVGVAGWDTLRLRTGPGTGHPAIAGIPPRACGVVRSGPCVGAWCAVRYRRHAGWVNTWYLD